jgi:ATP-dependent Clp protease ATP-binding subunit ClpC
MNGYNFTEQVRRTLGRAREEAVALQHEYVGTEHMLLGLLRDEKGVAADVLQGLAVDAEKTRQTLLGILQKGTNVNAGLDLPYTSRSKKVLEFAMAEARSWDHPYVGSEHLLVALVREQTGIAAQVLSVAGVNIDNVRAATLSALGEEQLGPLSSRTVRSVVVEIQMHDGKSVRRTFADSREAVAYLLRH